MVSMTKRADLTFSASRVRSLVKSGTKLRVSNKSPIFIAAVVEYLVAELLQVSGHCMRARKARRLSPRDIMLAVRNDPELSALLKDVTIAGAGVPVGTGGAKASKKEVAAAESSAKQGKAAAPKPSRKSAPTTPSKASQDSAAKPSPKQAGGKMAWAMGRLASMGFDDPTKAQEALKKTRGNVARATSVLLG